MGKTTGASTNVCLPVLLPLRSDPKTLPHIRRRLVGRDIQPTLLETEPAVIQLTVEGERVATTRVADEVVFIHAVQLDLWDLVSSVHGCTSASTDDMVDGIFPALYLHSVSLVVVGAVPNDRDVVVLGLTHDLVYRTAALDNPRVVLSIYIDRLTREQDLRLVDLPRDLPQPLALLAVDIITYTRIDAHNQQRTGLYREVGRTLVRALVAFDTLALRQPTQ